MVTERGTPSSRGISPWGCHSHLEKLLIVLVISLLLIVDRATTSSYESDAFRSTCRSNVCKRTASDMSDTLDRTVDPCDDFYTFACGSWIDDNPFPEVTPKWDVNLLNIRNKQIVQDALENIDLEEVESKAEKKARIYYDACLDEDTIETLGGTPLQKLIRDVGGWNISASGFQPHKFKLETTLQKITRYPMNVLFAWSVTQDLRNSSKNVISIDEMILGTPTRNNYLNKIENKNTLDLYLEFMIKISVLLGANETDARTQMLDVLEFETDLANITTPSENRRDRGEQYQAMSLQELQELSPFINWQDYFNNVFKMVSRKITTEERVVVYAKEYLVKLNTLVNRYARTEKGKNTLNNYLIWQTVRSLYIYLSKEFREVEGTLMEKTTGTEGDGTMTVSERDEAMTGSEYGEAMSYHESGKAMTDFDSDYEDDTERRYSCSVATDEAIGFATGAMFVREVFSKEEKSEAEKMIENIREAFKKNLQTLSWLDKETRDQAILKEDAMTQLIGFPDYILNAQELDQEYLELDVKPNEFFQNYIEVQLFYLKKILKKLDKPVNKTEWSTTPATVNAGYDLIKNQIRFPAGTLQFPYSFKNPKSITYGSIGAVMGHDLTHALDENGRKFDRFGNLNNRWTNDSIHQFGLRTECFRDQYSNYSVEGLQIDGGNIIGETVADNGGLKSAFHAYLKYSSTAAKNYTLPGLDYSHRQLFFISYAQFWCEATGEESDEHSFNKYRVIGALSNLPEFSQEFNCPLGSKMNPVKKCGVW